MIELNRIYNEDVEQLINLIPDESVDVIPIDPPYLYLKGQKLERPFDERQFFTQCKRILKKDGFVILFGRGTSFYRWNTILADLGFTFKEEIVWDKSYCSSPLLSVSRVHETITIHAKGKGAIKKVKLPYIEMKAHNIDSIIQDVKRLTAVFNNVKSMDAVLNYLQNNTSINSSDRKHNNSCTVQPCELKNTDRNLATFQAIGGGMNEKSIIRTDFKENEAFTKHNTTIKGLNGDGDRCVKIVNSMAQGMNEKTIIKEGRDHYATIHPTQKPVRLIERLLQLVVVPHSNPRPVAATFFSGSGAHEEACINLGIDFIGCELDKEYWQAATERIAKYKKEQQSKLFAA